MTKSEYQLLAHQYRLYRYNANLEIRSLLYCGQQDMLQEKTEAWLEDFLDQHPCLRPQLDWRFDIGEFRDRLEDKWENYMEDNLCNFDFALDRGGLKQKRLRLAKLDLPSYEDERDPTGQDEYINQLGGIGEIDEPTTLANMQ
ncbi:hypothetical protein CMI37_15155 [Candidatus Pacearchaeota archaeon]|nr:hypothetical protein [Candidatus Pacearchaeota archaeon]|tara:strand:+ start:891 stop:1319 length:429 start_codon:yes stop_codon:yes gene_type:complete